MSTKALLSIVAVLVVVGGGAWYFSTQNASPGVSNETENATEEQAGEASFMELVGRAGSWMCTVTTSIEEAPSEGTAYIADGKIRADFTSVLQGQSVVSHMISADGYVYTWSDAYPQGMKMLIPEGEEESSAANSGSVGYDSRVQYDCTPWTVDAAVFVPPGDVSFMELGAEGIPAGVPMPN